MRLRDIERELADAGFTFCQQRGSHRIYRHNGTGRTMVVVNRPDYSWYIPDRTRRDVCAHTRLTRGFSSQSGTRWDEMP
jgi:predicted RNA binding protein YcfA (HicA-like mRNA interferase family)